MYEYKMINVPDNTTDVTSYLQDLTNQEANAGWEFYRVDTVGVAHRPGCLGALLGQKENYTQTYIVSFRKVDN